jgi:hypothetical protein
MDFLQMAELSTRQWEILSRLVQGERAPTIAAAVCAEHSRGGSPGRHRAVADKVTLRYGCTIPIR